MSARTKRAPDAAAPEPAADPPQPIELQRTVTGVPAPPSELAGPPDTPGDRPMGLVQLTLDRGVRTTAIGQLYGLDFEIESKGFSVRVFFDQYSRRLKVLDYTASDHRAMVTRLRWLARENGFDKIFLLAPEEDFRTFLGLGFVLEGILAGYFGEGEAFIMSHFGSVERANSAFVIEESAIIEALTGKPRDFSPPPLPEGYRELLATPEHIPGMVKLYRQVFRTYPSPLTHPDYILQTMQRHIVYRVVVGPTGQTLSAASAEIDHKHGAAELSDCATRYSERGKGLMYHLLGRLEDDLRGRSIVTGFTYARARSAAMNRVFYRLGYEYSGRLINSCDISGQLEDMNLWVKPLMPRPEPSEEP
jgi:putative beta-lysine N-acetyltransferase